MSSQAEIAENVARGLSRLQRQLPVKLIVLAVRRREADQDTPEIFDLLVVYEGPPRSGAPRLVRDTLNLDIEPRLLSADEYARDRQELDPVISRGIVLFQEGTSGRRTGPARRGWRRSLRWLGNGLVALGVLIIMTTGAYYGYSYYSLGQMEDQTAVAEPAVPSDAAVQELAPAPAIEEDPSALASFLASAPGASSAATPRASSIGDDVPWEGLSFWPLGVFPPSRIILPSISVDSKVVDQGIVFEEGEWQWERPKNAVGHLKGTGDPGQAGNMVLSGHISSPRLGEGDVFKRLPDIKVGDVVIVYTQARAFTYQVTSKKVVLPTEISVLKPTTDETVTLITCVPDFIYSHRLIVTGKRVASG